MFYIQCSTVQSLFSRVLNMIPQWITWSHLRHRHVRVPLWYLNIFLLFWTVWMWLSVPRGHFKLQTNLGQWAASCERLSALPLLTLEINFKIHHQRNLTPFYRISLASDICVHKKEHEIANSSFQQFYSLLAVDGKFRHISKTVIAKNCEEQEMHHKRETALRLQSTTTKAAKRARSITSLMKFHVWCC